jgi:transcriptional regulator with XRE-family HTH domain
MTQPTLAEKLDRLFKAVRPAGRREYSYEEVSRGIRARGITTMSDSLLWELRTGKKDNPKMRQIEALADFFGVPVTYFFDTEESARLYEQIETLPIALDADVRRLALRAVDLSPDTLRAIEQIIEQARQIEGLHAGRQGQRRPPGDEAIQATEADER